MKNWPSFQKASFFVSKANYGWQ